MLEILNRSFSWQSILIACLGVMGLLQIFMVFQFELNWDEFLMLDWVYDWRAGEVILPFQTIYLRLFSWLPQLSESEITQIVTARVMMFVGVSIICTCLFTIAKRFFSTEAALMAVVAFLSFSFIFRHATSFRMDTIVTTLLMTVLWSVTHPKMTKRHILYSGTMIGLAGMITIKAVFYVPTIGTILLIRWLGSSWSRKAFLEGLAIAIISLVSFIVFYLYHTSSLADAQSGPSYLSSVVGGSLVDHGLFPSWYYMITSMLENPAYWILCLLGLFFVFRRLGHKSERLKAVTILSFAIPLLTLIFYLHGFPYYYTFMLAPVSILIAAAVDGLQKAGRAHYLAGVLPVLAFTYGQVVTRSLDQTQDYQKQVIETVHQIFPEPVNFIDRCGMIASHNQSWFFMASWQMREYYQSQQPNAAKILEQDKPSYILANVASLDLDHITEGLERKRLLPRDEAVFKEHYIHHWGPIYVPGKILQSSQIKNHFDILVAGRYTLEADVPVKINDILYKPGAYIDLTKGNYNFEVPKNTEAKIRWGESLFQPSHEPKATHLFRGF